MRKIGKLLFATALILGSSSNLRATEIHPGDSSVVSKTVTDFFHWYVNAIKSHKYTEFKPRFAANEKGMTTLDFSEYVANLKKYHFSDSLINRELTSYKKCVHNLKDTKFADFGKTKFIGLDVDEAAGCDFGNYHRWMGGQEPIDGIKITKIQFPDKNHSLITVEKFNYDGVTNKYFYWGDITVTLLKRQNAWKIDSIVIN